VLEDADRFDEHWLSFAITARLTEQAAQPHEASREPPRGGLAARSEPA
jgi:hypothetical protein